MGRRYVSDNGLSQWSACVHETLSRHIGGSSLGHTTKTFLEHVARLPLKHGGHLLSVSVAFGDCEQTEDRKSFQRELNAEIWRIRYRQPYDLASHHHDQCGQTRLSKSCYWRLQERSPGNKSRGPLTLPQNIIDRVVGYLFPVRQYVIVEHTTLVGRSQTVYVRRGPRTLRTTYIGWNLSPDVSRNLETLPLDSRQGSCIAFMTTNRQCCRLGINHLYTRLRFTSDPLACLAFLDDHQREEHRIQNISIQYDETTKCYTWRKHFNAFVHNRKDLSTLNVLVGFEFWKVAPWTSSGGGVSNDEKSANSVMRWRGWCKSGYTSCCQERNFLGHMARLPLTTNGHDL